MVFRESSLDSVMKSVSFGLDWGMIYQQSDQCMNNLSYNEAVYPGFDYTN